MQDLTKTAIIIPKKYDNKLKIYRADERKFHYIDDYNALNKGKKNKNCSYSKCHH